MGVHEATCQPHPCWLVQAAQELPVQLPVKLEQVVGVAEPAQLAAVHWQAVLVPVSWAVQLDELAFTGEALHAVAVPWHEPASRLSTKVWVVPKLVGLTQKSMEKDLVWSKSNDPSEGEVKLANWLLALAKVKALVAVPALFAP